MLPQYKKKTNRWVILSFLSRFVGAFLMAIMGLIFFGYVFFYTVAYICLFVANWNYAKGKGYSGAIGILLGLLDIIGLIIMVILPNRYKNFSRKSK